MCSFTLGRWIIPFLSTLVVQIGTMKCFYCPQNDTSVVPWDSWSPDDQIFLRDKYPDAGQGADLCVRSARPSAFFSRHSSSTSLSAPQSVDSGLQVPLGPLVVSGAATSLATKSVCPCTVPYPVSMHCAHALCPCAHALCRTLCPCTVPMRGIWGCRAFSVCCRVFYCCHRVCHRVPSD
jgi:hypothetical protein